MGGNILGLNKVIQLIPSLSYRCMMKLNTQLNGWVWSREYKGD